jgi:hypothetical protein
MHGLAQSMIMDPGMFPRDYLAANAHNVTG